MSTSAKTSLKPRLQPLAGNATPSGAASLRSGVLKTASQLAFTLNRHQ
ncbi:MAG: hypothetical protein V7K89_02920 [Nostoc sp.]